MRLSLFFSAEEKEIRSSIKNMFGYKPTNIFLYKQALRHRSVAKEIKSGVKNSNERLEFLGDAVLSVIVAEYLFLKFPFKDEGFLTEMRSKMVNRNQLNKISTKIGLGSLMELNLEGINQNTSIFGNALEAFIGAIFLDKGFDFTKKIVIERIINSFFDLNDLENTDLNFKSKLIEWAQKERKIIVFKVIETLGANSSLRHVVGVFIDDVLIDKAQGFSVKKAEKDAAELAYRRLTAPESENSPIA